MGRKDYSADVKAASGIRFDRICNVHRPDGADDGELSFEYSTSAGPVSISALIPGMHRRASQSSTTLQETTDDARCQRIPQSS